MQDHLGKKVRDWRKAKGWTQAKFATEAGISQPGLSLLEANGSARPETLRKIHKATGGELSPNALILDDTPQAEAS